ncbi:MAG: DUF2064 domain-containing protein [Wenzhouxiangella sp.]|nr:DUF2064 domain-containing protein [Wenzhouxiangella sp.]
MSAVAIFVKTPGQSAIKTRLAATIGASLAEQWHQRAAHAVAEVAVQANVGPVYWAVAEAEGEGHPLWADLPRLIQCAGGLGARMADIHNHLIDRHGQAILLGADTPQIESQDLRQTHRWLTSAKPRQVLGPASDGGFWLYGSNQATNRTHWERVSYSQTNTRMAFQEAFDGVGSWLTLATHTDVDEYTDLAHAYRALRALAHPSAKQRALCHWVEANTKALGGIGT